MWYIKCDVLLADLLSLLVVRIPSVRIEFFCAPVIVTTYEVSVSSNYGGYGVLSLLPEKISTRKKKLVIFGVSMTSNRDMFFFCCCCCCLKVILFRIRCRNWAFYSPQCLLPVSQTGSSVAVRRAMLRRWSRCAAVLPGLLRHRRWLTATPLDGALHQPGESGMATGSTSTVEGKETWSQFSSKMRHGRRRIRVTDVAAKMSYEYQMLKKMCRRRPAMRQWAVRDDFCDMSPGVVVMSPSMQAAYMKVFRLKDKGLIRQCLRDIIPIIEYRNREEKVAAMRPSSAELIPEGQPDTLNQKKKELFERKEVGDNKKPLYLHDHRSQAKLRFKIRQRLIKFQRQLAVANAVSTRSVLYSTDDAIGYFLFRGAAMYAGMHRVFFELSKQLPHFVPKTMLDFGAGTGTAILVAKEVYDPATMAYPLYRSLRQTMLYNDGAQEYGMSELRYDLKRLERNNHEKKKARFMAVAALLERGEVDPRELPDDLRRQIADVAERAATKKKQRLRAESRARHRELVDGSEWEDDDPLGETRASTEDPGTIPGEEELDEVDNETSMSGDKRAAEEKTWWEKLVDLEAETAHAKAVKRLRPLQEINAIEPSPGMMEIGTMVLHDDVPNVTWKRFLLPEDETIQHDLVVAAYSLSEIGDEAHRKRVVQQLWKMTGGVLVLVEFANLGNFNILMEARDTILEEKGVGLWDWQPTIVGPCPHESRCPLRHCKSGVKRQRMRICHTEAQYKATFIEVWARHLPLKVGIEPISYMIFARNELVPERATRREMKLKEEQAAAQRERDIKQRDLYQASLAIGDVVQERVSEEALHRPHTGAPPKLTPEGVPASQGPTAPASGESALPPGTLPTEHPVLVQTSNTHHNKLIYPKHYAPATHRFNRAFVDAGYQRQRAITPSEMLVVREEIKGLRDRVAQAAPQYLRVVRDPQCHGKIQAEFCTPEGQLITGRVYRRYYGDKQRTLRHTTLRWQHVGGWKLLKRIRSGSLFPNDVPMYAMTVHPQVDFPNTLLHTKHSTVGKTAMQYNDPLAPPVATEPLTREESIKQRKTERHKEQLKSVETLMENLFGAQVASAEATSLARIDAKREISAEEWVRAVQRAKTATVQQTKKVIPFASKMRAQKRSFEVRKRRPTREMAGNRKR
eukprot:gene4357-3169_t